MNGSVDGVYVTAGQATSCPAYVVCDSDGGVWLYHATTREAIQHARADTLEYASVIPGLPVDLFFADGGVFTPSDPAFRWPALSQTSRIPEWLERHSAVAIMAMVLIPAFLWAMVVHVIPAGARWSVDYLPDTVSREMGKQTLSTLDKIWFDPSELEFDTQQRVTQQWQQVLLQLGMHSGHYRLNFRASGIGANAFALPDGTVVVTDDLVRLTREQPDALTAILLHEIGHVQHQHGMQLVAQTTATSLLFTMMLGDIEGAGEMVLGAGVGLAQNAFSRDMEREADAFALEKLKQLSISPTAFADAMRLLMESQGMEATDKDSQEDLLQYISTHPGMLERIQAAEQAARSE